MLRAQPALRSWRRVGAKSTPATSVRRTPARTARTIGTGNGIRGWRADDPPPASSAPRSPMQLAIDAIAHRIARLSLFGRDPTRFASERSEIVAALRRLARG